MKTLSFVTSKPGRPQFASAPAFTRVDLAVTVAGLALSLALTLPALAHTASRAGQIVCSNNLRLIGQATQIFASEHGDLFPWRTPEELGGTSRLRSGNVWWEFAALSNQLATPKILACPSDTRTTRLATQFSRNPDGGLLHFSYRDNAISYMLGMDAFPTRPGSFVAGDRNMRVDATGVACSAGINNAAAIYSFRESAAQWTNDVHGTRGNLLLEDGGVVQLSNDALNVSEYLLDDNGSLHLLIPR